MAGTSFNAADIDFAALETKIAKLKPRKLEIEEVLGQVRARMVEQWKKGVTVAQLREALGESGIDVAERSLKLYLENGELPVRKKKTARTRAPAPAASGADASALSGGTVSDTAEPQPG